MLGLFEKKTVVLNVEGMMCVKCAGRVKTALEKIHGVSAEVDLEAKTVTVTCPKALAPEDLAKAVTDAGYPATVRE